MNNNITYCIALLVTTLFFSCSGGNDTSSDTDKETPPDEVEEMDRSRYNLNEPDEMLNEMQDSADIGSDTTRTSADSNP